MWASILQRHFPSSRWKKHYPKIIFFSLSVFHGLKPSFLWDIGPGVTSSQILNFVKDCKSLLKTTDNISVICIDGNICVTNTVHCLKALKFEHRKFVEIKEGRFEFLEENENLKQMIRVLEEKFLKSEDTEIWELNTNEIICPPCLFGVLLNYPFVYYFEGGDYSPFPVRLKVYQVSCQLRLDNVSRRFQVFAFSIPQSVLNTDIDNIVSLWFDSLQFSREDIFSDLSLESSLEEVDALILCGLLKEAAHYFRKCLIVDPSFIRAGHNLENVSNLAVERWHFRMLNDQHRNEAFREAIIKKIKRGFDTVLDVGTGTGILSLFAAEGQPKELHACDSSPVMTEIAEQVFHSNNILNINLLTKHSSEVQIPGDISKKVSLLITETFDAGLLGEDILDTLSHAWEHLLQPPQPQPGVLNPKFGIVIPFGASIYATGIELDAFANDFHLKSGNLLENCIVSRCTENYDTHDLSRAMFKCLTDTQKILEINFNDPKSIGEVLKGNPEQFYLKCKRSGRLDCFAVWFDLRLDEDIVLSTSPLSRVVSAWDQAIFPMPRSTTVKESQDVPVTVNYENKKLKIRYGCDEAAKFEASEEVIKTLNGEKLGMVFGEIANRVNFSDSVTVLDCYPFPVFGLNLIVKRKEGFTDELVCFVPNEKDSCLVRHVAEKYGVEVDVMVESETCFEDCLQEKRFDLILLDLVEVNGGIKDGTLLQLDYLKSLLKPGGLILPEEAVVIGQFIYSDWLCQTSKVINNSVTCGFNIAEYINPYEVKHFLDLDLNSTEKTICSEPFELFNLLDSFESTFEMTVPRHPSALYANAMVYWIKIKFSQTSEEILTNDDSCYRQAAILFSKMELPQEIKFNVIRRDGLFKIELLSI